MQSDNNESTSGLPFISEVGLANTATFLFFNNGRYASVWYAAGRISCAFTNVRNEIDKRSAKRDLFNTGNKKNVEDIFNMLNVANVSFLRLSFL